MSYSEYIEIMKKFDSAEYPWIKVTYDIGMPLGAYATEISSKYTTLYFGNTDLLSPKTTDQTIYYEQILLNKKFRNLFSKLNKINMDFVGLLI